jgi:hypothetical protein
MMATEEKTVIQVANERMSIIQACNELGMDIPDFSVKSMKVHCPFGHLFHADGGTSRAFAIYPGTNSAWCFAGCGYFTPVKLIAMDKGISEEQAAESILEQTSYVAPDYEARWNALLDTQITVNTDDLAEALKVACSRMVSDWDERQFETAVAQKLRQCLSLLPKVRSEEDASKWLAATKKIMQNAMGVIL